MFEAYKNEYNEMLAELKEELATKLSYSDYCKVVTKLESFENHIRNRAKKCIEWQERMDEEIKTVGNRYEYMKEQWNKRRD